MTTGTGNVWSGTDHIVHYPSCRARHRREAVFSVICLMTTVGSSTEGRGTVIGKVGRIIIDLQITVAVAAVAVILPPEVVSGVIPGVNIGGVITDRMTIATWEGQVCFSCMRALAPARVVSMNGASIPGVRTRHTVATVTFIVSSAINSGVGISGPLVGPIDTGRMAGGCTGTGGAPQDCGGIQTTFGIDRDGHTTLDRIVVNMAARWRGRMTADAVVIGKTVKVIIVTFASDGWWQGSITVQT